jgi:hypothetical protein
MGSKCFRCNEQAIAACPSCGRFYCPTHGGNRSLWYDGRARTYCWDCYDRLKASYHLRYLVAFILGAVILVFFILKRSIL